jgi:hypothetical protein
LAAGAVGGVGVEGSVAASLSSPLRRSDLRKAVTGRRGCCFRLRNRVIAWGDRTGV